jgi:hypothetical protein
VSPLVLRKDGALTLFAHFGMTSDAWQLIVVSGRRETLS